MRIAIIDVETLARNWWALLIRGIAAVIFGALTFMAPGISLLTLVLVFGAYAFADGVLCIVIAIRRQRGRDPWWVLLLEGLAGVGAGIVTLFFPRLTALALLFLIAAWAVVTGVLEIALAIRLRKVISGEWLLALTGLASLALGVVLMLFPGPGVIALVLWTGGYAIVFGTLLIALSLRLRSWSKAHDRSGTMDPGHPAQRPVSA
jgi:uncharacterized membrane protein HdeD (DUF308 family)